ncbi:MAG: ABC transporter ATP-binding protein [Verrucomicrobia bacterium]|nr:ABC transporter ATP-binding protein [Verrucomicrobiota bacterium]
MILEFEKVTCAYPGGFTLTEIDLQVRAGDMVGIVGPNGSGKTTLVRAASRTLRPRAGMVRVDGHDIWSRPAVDLARTVAVVSQSTEAVPMTVVEYVLLGRIPHYGQWQFLETSSDRDIAARAMQATGCDVFAEQLLTELSGGERQLALVARALAQEPRLLLLDEPTTYLDIAHQVQLLDLVRRLNRKLGLTVVMVMHDLNAASEYCGQLVLMAGGRVRMAGAPESVLRYDVLEDVYKTVLVVGRNSVTGKPHVFPVSEDQRAHSAAQGRG